MGEARRRKLAGSRALPQDEDGNYLLNLRQAIFVVLHAHDAEDPPPAPAAAIQRFINANAEAVYGHSHASDDEKIELFVAWLQGRIHGEDAKTTVLLQQAAEDLYAQAPDAMATFYAMARSAERMQ